MKRILLLITLILALASCKKNEYYTYAPESGTEADVEVLKEENYIVTDKYVMANKWLIVGAYEYNNNERIVWKLNVKGTNNYLIIDQAPATKFWKTGYQKGDTLDGGYVIGLNIKKV